MVNKILVANDIAEMLIANWRDVIRQMKSVGAHHRRDASCLNVSNPSLRLSDPQTFSTKIPHDTSEQERSPAGQPVKRHGSPGPDSTATDPRRRRSRSPMHATSHKLLPKMSMKALSPTREKSRTDDEKFSRSGPPLHGKQAAKSASSKGLLKPTRRMTVPNEDEDGEAAALETKEVAALSSVTSQTVDRRQEAVSTADPEGDSE